jgi:hypothetical protein
MPTESRSPHRPVSYDKLSGIQTVWKPHGSDQNDWAPRKRTRGSCRRALERGRVRTRLEEVRMVRRHLAGEPLNRQRPQAQRGHSAIVATAALVSSPSCLQEQGGWVMLHESRKFTQGACAGRKGRLAARSLLREGW